MAPPATTMMALVILATFLVASVSAVAYAARLVRDCLAAAAAAAVASAARRALWPRRLVAARRCFGLRKPWTALPPSQVPPW